LTRGASRNALPKHNTASASARPLHPPLLMQQQQEDNAFVFILAYLLFKPEGFGQNLSLFILRQCVTKI